MRQRPPIEYKPGSSEERAVPCFLPGPQGVLRTQSKGENQTTTIEDCSGQVEFPRGKGANAERSSAQRALSKRNGGIA